MHTAAAGPAKVRRLKKRSEFLRAARGQLVGRSAFSVQTVGRDAPEAGIGFTVTKQQGNSPQRNRIRRLLREIVRAHQAEIAPGWHFVVIGRWRASGATLQELERDWLKLAKRLGILLSPAAPPAS